MTAETCFSSASDAVKSPADITPAGQKSFNHSRPAELAPPLDINLNPPRSDPQPHLGPLHRTLVATATPGTYLMPTAAHQLA
jgi:hypothetical protein